MSVNIGKKPLFGVPPLGFEELKKYTNNFSEENFLTKYYWGNVFRGRNGDQNLTIKLWDGEHDIGDGDLVDELFLYTKPGLKGHPKPIAYFHDDNHPCAIVYDLDPLDTVHNLIPQDNFSWMDRIKVALGFAITVKSFHARGLFPFIIRGISAAHIICDQDYTPVLYDFGMIAGGFYTNRWLFDGLTGCDGYIDPYFTATGDVSTKTDVFAYGVVLLGLITKRVFNTDSSSCCVYEWAEKEYNWIRNRMKKLGRKKYSLVHESLRSQMKFSSDAYKITSLAMKCIRFEPDERPDMDEIIEKLLSLQIVKKQGNEIGINKLVGKL